MRVLTDCRERLTDLFPAGASWKKIEAPSLYALERDLWQALAGSSVAWTCELAATDPLAFWRRLIVISQAPRSQFDALHEELQRGLLLDGPTAVLALDGHEFHGQRDRPWSTVVGNLFLTVGLPVGTPADSYIPGLTMLPAVSLVDAIQLCAGTAAKPTIKWINDILIDGRKVAGVLTATVCRNGTIEAATLGLGVNVTHTPTIEPTAFVPGAGSLNGAGISVRLGQAHTLSMAIYLSIIFISLVLWPVSDFVTSSPEHLMKIANKKNDPNNSIVIPILFVIMLASNIWQSFRPLWAWAFYLTGLRTQWHSSLFVTI